VTNLLTPPFAALIALLPATLAAFWGYRLVRFADDPVLPERLLMMRNRNGAAIGFSWALLYSMGGNQMIWAVPLLIVTRMIAGHRVRKALYRDTWSLLGYCSFFTRLAIAAFGFWILLSMMPWLASRTGPYDWMVAAVLATVLVVGTEKYGAVFRAVFGARPVENAAIRSRFDEMATACALPNVALDQVDMRGGTLVNAVALPSIHDPGVLVTSTLFERLDVDEAAAVLAHELAHLEHYNRRRLRRLNAVTYGLIATGALLTPVARLTAPQALYGLMWLWQILLLIVLVIRARDRQKHETASDLRAVTLCGNADAVARALVKIHAAGRVPRRFDANWERHSSHPSLARRVQAIHTAAGTVPVSLGEAATFVTADSSTSVTFHDDRVMWNEQDGGTHAIPYRQLTTLRVDADTSELPRLVAVDSARRRWEFTLRIDDAARAQATLDIVDTRLGAAAAPPAVSLVLPRMLALMAVFAFLSIQQLPAAVIVGLAGMIPALPLIGAAGGASIGVATLLLRDTAFRAADWRPWFAVALLVCGVTFLIVNVMNRREATPRVAVRLIWVLAGATTIAWIGLVLSASNAMELYRGARAWPSAVILAIALGGAFAFMRSRAVRYASVPLIVAGLTAVFVGSMSFRDHFVRDPFFTEAEPVGVRAISVDPLAEFAVPFDVTTLWVSPKGSRVAFSSDNDDEVTTVHAGPVGGTLTSYDADGAAFVDEGRLLVLERVRNASVLRLVNLNDGSRTVWSRRLPLQYGRLSFDSASQAWHVAGWNGDEVISVAGHIGSDDVREGNWDVSALDRVRPLAVSNGNLLALETKRFSRSSGTGLMGSLTGFVLPAPRDATRLATLSDRGSGSSFTESRLDLTCASPAVEGADAMCAAFDGTRTRFFAIDADSGRFTPARSVIGHCTVYNDAGGGWVMGTWEREAILIRAASGEVLHVAASAREIPYEIAIGEKVVATVTSLEKRATVRIYSRP